MRALVTGGTGFIGNRLVLYLARNHWDVTCLVRRPVVSRLPQIRCITDASDLENIDFVFHLAAATNSQDLRKRFASTCISDFMDANAVGTARMLELAESLGAKSFVYTSTQLVIGKPEITPFGIDHPVRPESPYAISKLAGEIHCELFRRTARVAATSLRLTSVVGFGMATGSVLPRFADNALRSNDLMHHGSGERVQNFVHVDDVVRACAMAAAHPGSGVLNIGGASSLSMKDLAELVVRSTPASSSRVIPSGIADPQENYRWIPDLEPARAAIGYSPCVRMESFLPNYINALAKPTPVERWWEEQ